MTEKVIISGHLCLDIIPAFGDTPAGTTDLFKQGSLIPVGPIRVSTGGAVSNVGIALTRMGMDTVLNGKTGDDAFGGIIRSILTEYADVGSIRSDAGESSSYTIVLSPPGVDRILFHNAGANDTFSVRDVDYAACEGAALFHFGYPPLMRGMYADGGDNLTAIFSNVKAKGPVTSLDMAFPGLTGDASEVDWKRVLEKALPYVDLFCPSFEEAIFMLRPDEYRRMLDTGMHEDFVDRAEGPLLEGIAGMLLDMGAAMVLLKCGRRGLYLRTGGLSRMRQWEDVFSIDKTSWSDRQLWIPAYACPQMINAAGAGDCSIAGFIAAFVRGNAPEETLRTAALLGYQNLMVPDAFSGIRDWETTQSMAADSMVPIGIDPGGKGWLWDGAFGIWEKKTEKERNS